MLLVQRDHVVQDLAPATAHPPFRHTILPGRPWARSLRLQPRCLQESDHVSVELGVPVEDDVTVRHRLGESFPQLLHDPLRRRVLRDVEMQNLPASVLDDEEAIQSLEGHGRHGEEVEGHNPFAVILEKAQPAFAGVATPLKTCQVPGDGPLRDGKTEFQKFSVDPGRSPTCILVRQTSDQYANLGVDLRATAPRAGSPTPVEPETRAVPADDGFGLDEDENIGPAGPTAVE